MPAPSCSKRGPRSGPRRDGADSTDAAGLLDYWLDIMDTSRSEFPEDVVLSDSTGRSSRPLDEMTLPRPVSVPPDGFGFCFHRARFDDCLRERATDAGADYRVGVSVTSVETDLRNSPRHTVRLANGEDIAAEYVILADGPQRTLPGGTLDQFLPAGQTMADIMPSNKVNHIAYQSTAGCQRSVRTGVHRVLVGIHARPHRLPVDLPERQQRGSYRPDDAHRDGSWTSTTVPSRTSSTRATTASRRAGSTSSDCSNGSFRRTTSTTSRSSKIAGNRRGPKRPDLLDTADRIPD